jgi:hypothetical protein
LTLLISDNVVVVAEPVSKGDKKSPKPLLATDAIYGQMRTAVGWTIPELTKSGSYIVNENPEVILL